MAIGMLGSVLAGAAGGAGEAMQQNVAEQNKQTIAENLEQQRAATESMYQQAAEQRHIQQTIASRGAMSSAVNSEQAKNLQAQGLVMPGTPGASQPGGPGAEDNAAGTVATASEQTDAWTAASRKLGFMNPDDVLKYGTQSEMNQLKEEVKQMVAMGQQKATVEAARGRGVEAAEVNTAGRAAISGKSGNSAQLNSLTKQAAEERLGMAADQKVLGDYTAGKQRQADATASIAQHTARLAQIHARIDNIYAGGATSGAEPASGGALASGIPTAPSAPAPVSWSSLAP